MTNLHALLKKSIVDRGINDPRDREQIYSEAREAIIRRLFAQKPSLDDSDIDSRIDSFDTAVADLEADLDRYFDPGPGPGPGPAPAAAETAYAETAYESVVEESDYREAAADDMLPARAEPEASYHASDALAPEPSDPPEEIYYGDGDPVDDFTDDDGADEFDEPGAPDQTYDEALEHEDQPDLQQPPYDDEDYQAPDQHDRWVPQTANESVRPHRPEPAVVAKQRRGISERAKVAILVGTIASLIVVLIGVAVVGLMGGEAEDGVTVAIDVRREVSDAATASRIPGDDLPVVQTFVLFDGQDPTIFETTAENPVRFDTDGNGSFARVSSSAGSSGSRILIGPGLASELAGKRVRVRLLVRSSRERGALSMRFAYQSGIAISHWQTANLQADYQAIGLLWRVPAQRTSVIGDYLIIEPGIPGDGSGTDIKLAEIDVLAQ